MFCAIYKLADGKKASERASERAREGERKTWPLWLNLQALKSRKLLCPNGNFWFVFNGRRRRSWAERASGRVIDTSRRARKSIIIGQTKEAAGGLELDLRAGRQSSCAGDKSARGHWRPRRSRESIAKCVGPIFHHLFQLNCYKLSARPGNSLLVFGLPTWLPLPPPPIVSGRLEPPDGGALGAEDDNVWRTRARAHLQGAAARRLTNSRAKRRLRWQRPRPRGGGKCAFVRAHSRANQFIHPPRAAA